jgi:acyl-CoA thioesterase I
VERSRSIAIVAVLILSTASCTKSSAPPPPSSEQRAEVPQSSVPPEVPARQGPVIVTFGDSLTAGVVSPSYPDELQKILDSHGYNYSVDNQGVSGDTTTDGLARIDNVIVAHPALVILEFGGNDGLRGIPVDSTGANLEQMIQRLKDAKLPLVLLGITLPPNYGADYVRAFTAIYPDLAKKYHLKLMPFLLLHVYQDRALMQPDGIHPDAAGNKIVAQDVYQLIQPFLSRQAKH